jgi:hypothetical protein
MTILLKIFVFLAYPILMWIAWRGIKKWCKSPYPFGFDGPIPRYWDYYNTR